MTASLEAAFLQSIAAAPEDDTSRLVYADWLEENGDPPRGELIRIQCERAAREGEAGALRRQVEHCEKVLRSGRRFELWRGILADLESKPPRRSGARREGQIMKANRRRWLAGLSFPVEFRRGFPEVLEATAREYLCSAEVLERIAPVQAVRLMGYEPWEGEVSGLDPDEEDTARLELTEQLAACPLLERWVELELVACPGGEVFEALLTSPHLINLRRLVASNNEVGPGVNLVAGPRFAHLRWLDLYDSDSASGRPGNRGLIEIATSPHLARLEHLNYGGNYAGDEGLAALASSPTMTRLRSLCLSTGWITRAGIEALARSTTLASLRHLDLSGPLSDHRPDDAALAVLLESPLFARLGFLDLTSNEISDEGVRRLAHSESAAGLRALVLGGTRYVRTRGRPAVFQPLLSADSVTALAEAPCLAGLRRLCLPSVPMDDDAAQRLARSRRLMGLRELVVDAGPGLTAKGREALRARFGAGLMIRTGQS
jgi:uncharacterized protein (TIGR02996 family)